jgi:general secretion pathway protein G
MQRYRARRRQAALTLIELLVVMVILVILAGSITFYVANKADQARISRAKADLAALEQGIEAYNAAMGEFPTTEQGLMALWKPPSGVVPDKWHQGGGPFIKQQSYNDPWGHPYQYRSPGAENRDYEIVCLGADGKEGGDGKNADVLSWELNAPGSR